MCICVFNNNNNNTVVVRVHSSVELWASFHIDTIDKCRADDGVKLRDTNDTRVNEIFLVGVHCSLL